jgi:hypothetical protein
VGCWGPRVGPAHAATAAEGVGLLETEGGREGYVGGTSVSVVCGASRRAVLWSSKRGEAGKYSGALEFAMQGGATLEGEGRWEADPSGRSGIFGWWPSTSNLPVLSSGNGRCWQGAKSGEQEEELREGRARTGFATECEDKLGTGVWWRSDAGESSRSAWWSGASSSSAPMADNGGCRRNRDAGGEGDKHGDGQAGMEIVMECTEALETDARGAISVG